MKMNSSTLNLSKKKLIILNMRKIKMNLSIKSHWKNWIPNVLILSWLLFLGISIWQHALVSGQPPLYDPLTYMSKAKHFWEAVELGKPFNPMNLIPSVRPPGSILMSYPFGFSDSFLGFHFRSVFIPILCMVVSVYITAGTAISITSAGWVAAIAVLFSTLPMFYHFDLSDETFSSVRWGLVDNFQASIAAMAMAATIRSLMTKSQLWLLFSISLAALTLLIKPSGLMVMALLAWTWFVTVACQWRCASRCLSPDRLLLAYALKGTVVFLIFYGSVIAVCVFSEYLSEQNFAFAKKVLVTMDEACRISLHDSYRLLHSSSGEVLLIWIIGVASMFTYGTIFGKKPMTQLQATVVACLLSSIIIWILGTWYWLIVQAGGV